MSIKFVKAATLAMAGTLTLTAGLLAHAQDEKPRSLDQLLEYVKQGQISDAKENRAREQAFARDKANQAKMLQDAEAERRREEQRSDRLETAFDENEIRIGDLQEQLDRGGLLLWVHTRDAAHEERATEILRRHSGRDVHVHDLPAG